MKRCITAVLLILAMAAPASAQWHMDEFMIMGWTYWFEDVDPEIQVRVLADAGLNVIMGTRDKLDICEKYGIKLIVRDIAPEEVPEVKDHPALWGYWIVDEPLRNFPAVAALKEAYHEADPDHPAYVNLVSRAGDYLGDYMETVRPELLSYDYYQWWWGFDGHFPKLEIHRDAALDAGVPLACWVETNAAFGYPYEGYDKSRPSDNEARLRMSIFTSLAYGVKGIEWFTLRRVFNPDGKSLNECGKDIAAINADLGRLGPILVNLRSVAVYHLPPLPRGARETPEKHWVHMLQSGYPNLVMGEFKDEDNGDYLMVANTNWMHDKLAVLEFTEPALAVEKFDKKTGDWLPLAIRKDGVSEANRHLVDRNINHLMYSQRTGGHLVEHFQHNRDRWLSDSSGSQFVEFTLMPGDGDLLRVTRNLGRDTVRF